MYLCYKHLRSIPGSGSCDIGQVTHLESAKLSSSKAQLCRLPSLLKTSGTNCKSPPTILEGKVHERSSSLLTSTASLGVSQNYLKYDSSPREGLGSH